MDEQAFVRLMVREMDTTAAAAAADSDGAGEEEPEVDAAGGALRRMAGGIGLASEEPGWRSASRLGNAGDGVSGSAFGRT